MGTPHPFRFGVTLLGAASRMVAPAVEGVDLFKIAGRSISGWMKSFKTGTASHVL